MGRPLRSAKGCWTCRLRRKKCDERSPICSLCDSLMISCYGYGPKPDWMNGGEIEKEKLEGFKQIVKYTSRRRGKSKQNSSQQSHSDHENILPNAPQSTLPADISLSFPNNVLGVNCKDVPSVESWPIDSSPDSPHSHLLGSDISIRYSSFLATGYYSSVSSKSEVVQFMLCIDCPNINTHADRHDQYCSSRTPS
jgi:hypothetical protein